jgi:hypothetical protein
VNKGQQGSTERVITRGKRAKLFELSEKPRHFLASRILLFIRNNFLGASRLAWDDRFDALLGKQLPAGIAVIALLQDRSGTRREGGEIVPHERQARGIVPCPTGHEQADASLVVRAGGRPFGGTAAPRAAQSLGVWPPVFFRAPAAC